MKVIRGLEQVDQSSRCVVTVGTFDGVHPGHLRIIERLRSVAKEKGFCSTLVSFYPHPKLVIRKDAAKKVKLLTTIDEKIEILESTGLSRLVVIPFDENFARTSYESFVKNILVEKLGAQVIIVGYDHAFGKNREGNFERLQELGNKYEFDVERIEPLRLNETTISSTLIRNTVLTGDVARAAELLDRPYSMSGTVVHGSDRGKDLNFPTANIEIADENKLIPSDGVYAVDVIYRGEKYKGMLNIGVRPTFQQDKIHSIEANIFDFKRDIYGEKITIKFKQRLRDEIKFDSKDALIKQLELDKEKSLKI